jgi:hypothetical protein
MITIAPYHIGERCRLGEFVSIFVFVTSALREIDVTRTASAAPGSLDLRIRGIRPLLLQDSKENPQIKHIIMCASGKDATSMR